LESIVMVLVIKLAQFLSRLNDAFSEALAARQAARRKYPHVPEE
jgi:hypothetical protein